MQKFIRFVVSIFLTIGLGIGGAALAAPAQAASPTLDTFFSVTSVTVNTNGTATVKVNLKKYVDPRVGVHVGWSYPEAWRMNGINGRVDISGNAGLKTYTVRGIPTYLMTPKIAFGMYGISETRTYQGITTANRAYTTSTISAALAAANAVAVYIPGAVLTFVPQGRVVKFAGATILGFSVAASIQQAVTNKTTSCPALKAGQFIQTWSWITTDGTTIYHRVQNIVWSNQADYNKGVGVQCNVSYIAAAYR